MSWSLHTTTVVGLATALSHPSEWISSITSNLCRSIGDVDDDESSSDNDYDNDEDEE